MPQKLVWTAPSDARLKRLRAEGQSWDRIAAELGISRNAAIERGRRIGARLPPPEHKPEPEDPDREAMPPGHWVSWGVITAGTCLADEPYVYQNPVLRRDPALEVAPQVGCDDGGCDDGGCDDGGCDDGGSEIGRKAVGFGNKS